MKEKSAFFECQVLSKVYSITIGSVYITRVNFASLSSTFSSSVFHKIIYEHWACTYSKPMQVDMSNMQNILCISVGKRELRVEVCTCKLKPTFRIIVAHVFICTSSINARNKFQVSLEIAFLCCFYRA